MEYQADTYENMSAAGLGCLLKGTLIATQRGEVPVERLGAGDRIVSRDRGLVAVKWVGMFATNARQDPDNAPVRIPRGALGTNAPARDLYLAPDQRVWMAHPASGEVLVPVRDLIGWQGIAPAGYVSEPEYVLVLCDRTEIILADGLQVESAHPGPAIRRFTCLARDRMLALFPDLVFVTGKGAPARRHVNGAEARGIVGGRAA